jgi:hypothetical protein
MDWTPVDFLFSKASKLALQATQFLEAMWAMSESSHSLPDSAEL